MLGGLARRGVLLAAAGAACGATASEPRRYAVVSFIADRIEIVVPVQGTGSRIDRNLRRELPDTARAFEGFALVAAGMALEKADRGATASLVSTGATPFHDQPERLFDRGSLALPDAVVDAIEQARATHLVLLTKHRDEARLRFYNSYVGSGRLRGIGYYLDHDQGVVVRESGAVADGFIAPYVFVRVSLVDVATGRLAAQETITESIVVPVAASNKTSDPWNVLDAAHKVRLLRDLLEQSIAETVRRIVAR
jgi:hypothetical protein